MKIKAMPTRLARALWRNGFRSARCLLSRREADRVLDDPAMSGHRIGALLRAASAPARRVELRGEQAAARLFGSSMRLVAVSAWLVHPAHVS